MRVVHQTAVIPNIRRQGVSTRMRPTFHKSRNKVVFFTKKIVLY